MGISWFNGFTRFRKAFTMSRVTGDERLRHYRKMSGRAVHCFTGAPTARLRHTSSRRPDFRHHVGSPGATVLIPVVNTQGILFTLSCFAAHPIVTAEAAVSRQPSERSRSLNFAAAFTVRRLSLVFFHPATFNQIVLSSSGDSRRLPSSFPQFRHCFALRLLAGLYSC